jgi:hypothetical protein
MKNVENNKDDPINQNVTNNLTVGNNITAGGTVSGNIVTANTVSSNTMITGTLSTTSINFGAFPFTYATGTWTPVQATLKIIGLGPSCSRQLWFDERSVSSAGYYVKIGAQVTVYFETTVTFDGFSNDSLSYRTPIIEGLPFVCRTSTPINVNMSGVIEEASFPNGYALGVAPPLAVTMDGGFTVTALEVGSTFVSATPPLYANPITYVTDGRTLFLTCSQSQYTLIGAIAWSGLNGNVYNANVIFTGTNYISAFKGSLTYFTDE